MIIQGHNINVTVFAAAIEVRTAQELTEEPSIRQRLTTNH